MRGCCACWPRSCCSRPGRAPPDSPSCGLPAPRCRPPRATSCSPSRWSASAPRRASSRSTSGCRARIPPSHVSALMSGVMIKLGVYGLLRFALDLLGAAPAWWGALVIGLGALSAVLGVLYALMEHDLKRLLAFHSVENIGIIFIAIGAGLMFRSFALPAMSALGIVAALYHT